MYERVCMRGCVLVGVYEEVCDLYLMLELENTTSRLKRGGIETTFGDEADDDDDDDDAADDDDGDDDDDDEGCRRA